MLVTVTSKPLISGLRMELVEPTYWEELNICPICQQAEYLRDVMVVEGESPSTVACVCLDCEYGFLRKRPSKEWFNLFYSKEWDQVGRMVSNVGPPSIRPKAKVLNFCASHLPPSSNVLDVGAGFGGQLLAFKEEGHNAFGIERSEHRAKFVQENLGIPCLHSPLESASLPNNRFDLVYSNHVLEHVSKPDEVISQMARLLSDKGMIYIAVPDFWQEYPPQSCHFVPHLSWFTTKALNRLLMKNGFRIIKVEIGKEIQLLASKTAGSQTDLSQFNDVRSDDAFSSQVSDWIFQSFGGMNGSHTLVWYKAENGELFYNRQVFKGDRFMPLLIKMTRSAQRALPKRVWNRSPNFLANKKLRELTVELRGQMDLPVSIKYKMSNAPVWVK